MKLADEHQPQHLYSEMEDFLTALAKQRVAAVAVNKNYGQELYECMLELEQKQQLLSRDPITCLKHGACPGCSWLAEGGLKVIVAGTICIAWSSMGSQQREGHPTMLPFLIWIFLLRALTPDIVIHECVVPFDVDCFRKYLGATFECQTIVLNPTSFGWPVQRQRRYTALLNTHTVHWVDGGGHPCSLAALHRVFGASLELTGECFFMTDQEDLTEERASFAKKRMMDPEALVDDWKVLYTHATQNRISKFAGLGVDCQSSANKTPLPPPPQRNKPTRLEPPPPPCGLMGVDWDKSWPLLNWYVSSSCVLPGSFFFWPL